MNYKICQNIFGSVLPSQSVGSGVKCLYSWSMPQGCGSLFISFLDFTCSISTTFSRTDFHFYTLNTELYIFVSNFFLYLSRLIDSVT